MSVNDAIELITKATDVETWNTIRDDIHLNSTEEEWKAIYEKIDMEGFIVKTLQKNKPHKIR